MYIRLTWTVRSNPVKKSVLHSLFWNHEQSTVSLFFHSVSHFLSILLSDLVLLQIPLRIPHPVNYCSLLSSRPPPPFHSVTVDTWHLETTCVLHQCWSAMIIFEKTNWLFILRLMCPAEPRN